MSQAKSLLLMGERRVILIAEEDRSLIEQLRLQLQRVGYDVIGAESGLVANSLLQSTSVDAILSNISLPQVSGLDLLRITKQDKTRSSIPFFLFAQQTTSEDIAAAIQLGADDFLSVPFDYVVLRAKLAAQIKKKTNTPTRSDSSNAEPQLLAGSLLAGRYRLDERIGDGSFGAVFKATHLDLKRTVAIKVLQTLHLPEKEALIRFRMEGIAACRLPHPNIVGIFDYGMTPDGIAYLVMELLSGRALSRDMDQKAQSPERCLEVILPIADAIAFAHQNHVIHRDIKPENIYLHNSSFGEIPKLIDFGLVKFGDTAEDNDSATSISTMKGHVLGTVSYMAPERFREKPYTGLVDVYGLGITMYEMLTGRPPFASRKSPLDIAKAHLYDKPATIRDRFPYIPEELEVLVLSTLEKDPQKRPSALEVAQRLFSLQSNRRISPHVVQTLSAADPMQTNAHQMPTVLFQHSAFRDAPTIQFDQEELLSLDDVYDAKEEQTPEQ
jgi:serine/threonine protein kinase/CheY-like chemotaxis protein